MTANDFNILKEELNKAGYGDELDWQMNVQPCDNENDFFGETCWVILNSGMKEQIARIIWERIKEAWRTGNETATAFNHKGKVAAIDYVKINAPELFRNYLTAQNKIEFLQTIPFIGKITCWHLAKNLGVDCVKPDRHLVRIANQYNQMPDGLCEKISKETGNKKSVVDIVIWRACNLKWI